MNSSTTIEKRVPFVRGSQGRKPLRAGSRRLASPVPRIAQMMALAIHFDELIRTGKMQDQSKLARLGQVPVARISQIMGLLHLAPEIQEQILFLETGPHASKLTEKILRGVAMQPDWNQQKKYWELVGMKWKTA